MNVVPPHLFGQIALREGLIKPEQLEEALRLQASAGKAQLLGRILVERGYLSDRDVARIYASQLVARKDLGPGGGQPAPTKTPSGAFTLPPAMAGTPAGAAVAAEQTLFGKYLLTDVLGKGFSQTYKVWDSDRKTFLALKLGPAASAAPEEIKRFREDAQAASQLTHPNIVKVHEVNEVNGRPYLLTDFVAGTSLAHLVHPDNRDPAEFASNKGTTRVYRHPKDDTLVGEIRKALKEKKPLQRDHLLRLLAEAARGVNFAHENGVLHRDLKPHNLIADLHGRPIITDFASPSVMHRLKHSSDGRDLPLPAYTAPEMLREGAAPDKFADIYSLGAILYECLTGRSPYEGAPMDVVRLIQQQDPVVPTLVNPGVPPELEAVCLKAMERKKDLRYATALELAEDLERFLYGGTVRARPSGSMTRAFRRNRLAASFGGAALLLLAWVGYDFWALSATSSTTTPSPESGQVAQLQAEARKAAREPGQIQRAFDLYTQAIRLQGSNLELWYERGLCANRMGRYDSALKDFKTCMAKGVATGGSYYYSGRIWMEACQDLPDARDQALENFRNLLHEDVAGPFADLTRACILGLEGNLEKALQALDKIRTDAAGPAEIPMIRAWVHLHQSTPNEIEAIKCYHAAIEAAPGDEHALFQRARLYVRMGKYAEAKRDLDRALAITPVHRGMLKDRGYLNADHLKDYDAARRDLEKALTLPGEGVDTLEGILRLKLSLLPR